MSYPRYIARVPGEAFDADQIEHGDDDGHPQDYALLRAIEADWRAKRAKFEAKAFGL